ncbi:MAG TPA: hypothetical protein VF221_00875 [Chloroflexota bacterium]
MTPIDRVNIATERLHMLHRFISQQNKFRALDGKPPIPMRDKWDGGPGESR